MYIKLSASGGLRPPLTPHQGHCPWTPLGLRPQTPVLARAPRARHGPPPLPFWQILDPPLAASAVVLDY